MGPALQRQPAPRLGVHVTIVRPSIVSRQGVGEPLFLCEALPTARPARPQFVGVIPPSTFMVVPVIEPARGLATKATKSATSSGTSRRQTSGHRLCVGTGRRPRRPEG